eukprot:11106514-Prorocentrum_lima.AAC.1
MRVPDDDEDFEDPPQPPTQHVGPHHPLQGDEDVEVRSDTPTVVADSSPPPFSQPAVPSSDPAAALQHQLH